MHRHRDCYYLWSKFSSIGECYFICPIWFVFFSFFLLYFKKKQRKYPNNYLSTRHRFDSFHLTHSHHLLPTWFTSIGRWHDSCHWHVIVRKPLPRHISLNESLRESGLWIWNGFLRFHRGDVGVTLFVQSFRFCFFGLSLLLHLIPPILQCSNPNLLPWGRSSIPVSLL